MLTLCCLVYQIFFAAVGAAGSIRIVMRTAPSLFLFSTIQISIHLAITLGVGKLFGFQRRDLLLASNANVGGKTVATPSRALAPAILLWVAWLGFQTAVLLTTLILCQGSLQLQNL